MFAKCVGNDTLPASFLPVWAKKSKYDSLDGEMIGMPVDIIDTAAAAKAKEKGIGGTIRRH
jgi:hypothetical protein